MHVSGDSFPLPAPRVRGPVPSVPIAAGRPDLSRTSLAHAHPDDWAVDRGLDRATSETLAPGAPVAQAPGR